MQTETTIDRVPASTKPLTFDSTGYEVEHRALLAGGVSPALAGVLVTALREHDAAGQPAINLPTRADIIAGLDADAAGERATAALGRHLAQNVHAALLPAGDADG